MKTKALIIPMFALATLFASCNNEETVEETALAEAVLTEVIPAPISEVKETTLYVTAPSGLSLRKHNNLNSEKLAVMPHGTPVKVIDFQNQATMTVGGIKGGMHKVVYNNKEGYAFNGYLSTFFPPEKGTNAAQYVTDLQATHPKAQFVATTGGTASSPSNTETVTLPTTNWTEAFYIAQKLYEIPSVFSCPSQQGTPQQTLVNPKKPSYISESEMRVERGDEGIEKITYLQAGEGYGSTITLFKEDGSINIAWSTIINE